MFYTKVLRPIFFKCDPEFMHDFMVFWGEVFGAFAPARWLISLVWGYRGKDISKIVDGVRYERPVLLSAGFDTDGKLSRILYGISFGGEEDVEDENMKGLGLVDFYFLPHLNNPHFAPRIEANLKKAMKGIDKKTYVLDDQSALKVIDGNVEIVDGGKYLEYN